MKTIYLLTNFTDVSGHAIASFMDVFGPGLHKDHRFVLLNTWKKPRAGRFQLINLDEVLSEWSANELAKEARILEEKNKMHGLRIATLSAKGDIVQVLNALKAPVRPFLLVMGTKGSNLLRELFAGSTTGRILRQVNAPVLLIPGSATFHRPERIVFATDLLECRNKKDFVKLMDIVRMFMAELLILHIYRDDKPDTAHFEACMAPHLEGIRHSFHYKQHLDTAKAISEFSVNMHADLLSLIVHPGGLLFKLFTHSVSVSLTKRPHLPMLLIHG